ncbi:MAG: hypothetical protein AB7V04_04250 [Desulfomonilaceae bacterium]
MVRSRLWFRCAAMRDPVLPRLHQPAQIGWFGKKRNIDLVIEREFTGTELLKRMKGWITLDPIKAIEILEDKGRLRIFDDGELIVETETMEDMALLQDSMRKVFGDQCDLEIIPKN